MHKSFCASGFLYNPDSQQILLQQNADSVTSSSQWKLFEGVYGDKDQPESIFKSVLQKLFKIKSLTVVPVYSYFNESEEKDQNIYYASLSSTQNFPSKNGLMFAWFSFKEITKLHLDEQTKHDIIVGQRVIEAAMRKQRGEHTFQ